MTHSELIKAMRDSIELREIWQVVSPDETSCCFSASRREYAWPEQECEDFLADFRKRQPEHKFCSYHVRKYEFLTPQSELLKQAADALEQLTQPAVGVQWQPSETAKTWPAGSVVVTRRDVGTVYHNLDVDFDPQFVDGDESRPGKWQWALVERETNG